MFWNIFFLFLFFFDIFNANVAVVRVQTRCKPSTHFISNLKILLGMIHKFGCSVDTQLYLFFFKHVQLHRLNTRSFSFYPGIPNVKGVADICSFLKKYKKIFLRVEEWKQIKKEVLLWALRWSSGLEVFHWWRSMDQILAIAF